MIHVTKTVVSLILASPLGSQSVSPSLDLNLKNKLEKSAVSLNNENKYLQDICRNIYFTWLMGRLLLNHL